MHPSEHSADAAYRRSLEMLEDDDDFWDEEPEDEEDEPERPPMTTFTIPGHPRPQGSKRHVGNGRMIESSKHLKPWRDKCIQVMRLQNGRAPIDTPVKVTAEFIMPRPKRLVNPYPYQGDLDKLQRCMGDAMELAGVLTNDSRIITWHATKRYANPDEQPGAHITITQIIH